jgi:AcrR family transcriptional regulator
MEKRGTKQIILNEALELFSANGYEGVSVNEIASAVGIKAASLYKHYKSKQEIFDCILSYAADGFKRHVEQLGVNGYSFLSDIKLHREIILEMLMQTGMSIFQYSLHDEVTRKLRRMFTIEQYKNNFASKLFTSQYINAPLNYQSTLFKTLIEQGAMKNLSTDIAAAHFYSPIYLMLCLCDNNPEWEDEALDFLRDHITQFTMLYMVDS